MSGGIRFILSWVVVAIFVAGLVVLLWTTLHYLNQEYVITNRRVMQVGGVLNITALLLFVGVAAWSSARAAHRGGAS